MAGIWDGRRSVAGGGAATDLAASRMTGRPAPASAAHAGAQPDCLRDRRDLEPGDCSDPATRERLGDVSSAGTARPACPGCAPGRRQDADLVGGVGGFERDRGAAAAEALQRRFLVVDQRHDDVAGVGARRDFLISDGVAVEDAGLDHRIAAHLEREVLAGAEAGRAAR